MNKFYKGMISAKTSFRFTRRNRPKATSIFLCNCPPGNIIVVFSICSKKVKMQLDARKDEKNLPTQEVQVLRGRPLKDRCSGADLDSSRGQRSPHLRSSCGTQSHK